MKFKLIYEEGYSYYGGYNPCDENWKKVVEHNGKYYEITNVENYTNQYRNIGESDFNKDKALPEEYEKTVPDSKLSNAYRVYKLVHGNNKEIKVNLTNYDRGALPKDLLEEYDKENAERTKEEINEAIKHYPELNYNETISNANDLVLR